MYLVVTKKRNISHSRKFINNSNNNNNSSSSINKKLNLQRCHNINNNSLNIAIYLVMMTILMTVIRLMMLKLIMMEMHGTKNQVLTSYLANLKKKKLRIITAVTLKKTNKTILIRGPQRILINSSHHHKHHLIYLEVMRQVQSRPQHNNNQIILTF
jgi:hypothetical protein